MLIAWIAIQFLNKWSRSSFVSRERASRRCASHDGQAGVWLPGFIISLSPIILPILLISLASVFDVVMRGYKEGATGFSATMVNLFGGKEGFNGVKAYVDFIGNKNIALVIGAAISLWLLKRQRKLPLNKISDMVGSVGNGRRHHPHHRRGRCLRLHAFPGRRGRQPWDGRPEKGINLMLLSYAVALVFRIAQGTATVSMQTTSAMLGPHHRPGCHPIYLFRAIGFGAMAFMDE